MEKSHYYKLDSMDKIEFNTKQRSSFDQKYLKKDSKILNLPVKESSFTKDAGIEGLEMLWIPNRNCLELPHQGPVNNKECCSCSASNIKDIDYRYQMVGGYLSHLRQEGPPFSGCSRCVDDTLLLFPSQCPRNCSCKYSCN